MEKREENELRENNRDQNLDSPINTAGTGDSSSRGTLTNDETSSTDPNEVDDKPSFSDNDRNVNDRGRFDGEIGI